MNKTKSLNRHNSLKTILVTRNQSVHPKIQVLDIPVQLCLVNRNSRKTLETFFVGTEDISRSRSRRGLVSTLSRNLELSCSRSFFAAIGIRKMAHRHANLLLDFQFRT